MGPAFWADRKRSQRMRLSTILASVVGWLRAGYPEQAPKQGYVPLLVLAPARLSEADVDAIADELIRAGRPVSVDVIRAAITARSQSQPLDSDIARISARLVVRGGPSSGQRLWDHGTPRRRLHRAG
jgi:Protein of unknown function (DUF3349)